MLAPSRDDMEHLDQLPGQEGSPLPAPQIAAERERGLGKTAEAHPLDVLSECRLAVASCRGGSDPGTSLQLKAGLQSHCSQIQVSGFFLVPTHTPL